MKKMPYGETLIRTRIKTLIQTLIFEHGKHGRNENINVILSFGSWELPGRQYYE